MAHYEDYFRSDRALGLGGTAGVGSPTLSSALRRAELRLLSVQKKDGHWCGELEGCTILESEYMLLLEFLGRSREERFRSAAEHIRRQQRDGGAWAIYPGGPDDLSTSIKAYLALKLAGDPPGAEHMARARRGILDLGGTERANSFTKIQLALFGQYEWARCPAIPPEMILLPPWSPFSIYDLSSWSRVMVVPLSVLWALRPIRPLRPLAAIPELRASQSRGRDAAHRSVQGGRELDLVGRAWRAFFRFVDLGLRHAERLPIKPLRRRALEEAERWLSERADAGDGIGAIFPPMVNAALAFCALGHPQDHPLVRGQLRALERLEVLEDGALRLQPCKGPVWDTSLAVRALLELGQPPVGSIEGVRWLLDKEVAGIGEHHSKSGAGRGGWYFQYDNRAYPDCDDTAQVLACLAQVHAGVKTGVNAADAVERAAVANARDRAVRWLLAMQNGDGGWAAFDRGCDRRLFTFIPFADHNAMIDPSCPDITGRVIDALTAAGVDRGHRAIRRGVEYLRASQEPDGTWYGRWGCNYIYGTWLALQGLAAAGEDLGQARHRLAVEWLKGVQTESGGWGESLQSYDDPRVKGQGTPTATQTAWALLGLFAAGDFDSSAVRRGVAFLLRTQSDDGGWRDEPWTGTGFPRVFYLRYHLYQDYFPLLALAAYQRGAHGVRALGAV